MRLHRTVPFLAFAALLLAACGGEADAPAQGDGDAALATLAVAESPLGPHLVDGDGLTLYLFDADEPGVSNCSDGCLDNWPPLIVDGEPVPGDGVDPALVGTIVREDDGSTQVTYDGLPLYRWVGDRVPGDVEGQGVNDAWWVVAPTGVAITTSVDGAGTDDGGGEYSY